MDKKRLTETIEKQIAQCLRDKEQFKESAKPVSPDRSIGRLSRLEAISDKSVAEANLEKCNRRLSALRLALSRIDSDSFGICQECEEPISEKRLEILPESTVCMACLKERS